MTEGFKEYYNHRQWLSISSLLSFARCPRRYFYGSGCRLRPVGGEHSALLFGSAIHKALPELLTGDDKKMERAVAAFASVFDETADPTISDKKRCLSRAKAMLLDFYISHLGRNSLYSLLPPPGPALELEDKVSDYEVPFAIDIGLDVPLVGRIDGLVRHRDTGLLWGLEWKTSSELSARFLDSFQNSVQVIAYTLALRTYTNAKIEGVMVEGLRVSPSNAENLLTCVSVPDFKIDDFIKWARYHGNMLLQCERSGEFPKFFSGCTPYGMFGSQGYNCDFSNLCSVPDWTSLKNLYAVSNERPFVLNATGPDEPNLAKLSLPVVS